MSKIYYDFDKGYIINKKTKLSKNLLNANYAPNGYTWGYLFDGIRTDENFVFPMAGRNFFLTYSIKLDRKK